MHSIRQQQRMRELAAQPPRIRSSRPPRPVRPGRPACLASQPRGPSRGSAPSNGSFRGHDRARSPSVRPASARVSALTATAARGSRVPPRPPGGVWPASSSEAAGSRGLGSPIQPHPLFGFERAARRLRIALATRGVCCCTPTGSLHSTAFGAKAEGESTRPPVRPTRCYRPSNAVALSPERPRRDCRAASPSRTRSACS
jgi:hypothetical protein